MADNKAAAFKAQYQAAADAAGDALGVSSDVLLAQWGHETGWGKSVVPGTNNLGNIKDFTGTGVTATDNQNGSVDKYRQYASPLDFANDYISLIRRKYPSAVGAGDDPTAFTSALKQGGYAEDANYVPAVGRAYSYLTGRSAPPPSEAGSPMQRPVYSPETAQRSFGELGGTVPAATRADLAASWNELPADPAMIKAGKEPTEKYTKYEQSLIMQTQGDAARAGYSGEDIVTAGKLAEQNIVPMTAQSQINDVAAQAIDTNPIAGATILTNATQKAVDKETQAQKAGFWTKVDASIHAGGISSPVQALTDWLVVQSIPRDVVPFDFSKNWESNLSGLSAEEQENVISRGQGSAQAWELARMQEIRKRHAVTVRDSGGTASTVAAQLFVGAVDPVGMVAFAGVGKVAQLAGVGARAYAAAGRPVSAVFASGAENAVGGLLLDATVAAAGNHVTLNDLVQSTGINMGFGSALGLLHLRKAQAAEINSTIQASAQATAEAEHALWLQAQENLGNGASEALIRAEVDRLQVKGINDILDISLAPVPQDRRLLPHDVSQVTPVAPEVQAALERRYGTAETADPAERALQTMLYEHAENIVTANPIDQTRFSKFTSAIGLESIGQTMLKSKNPLMQALGIIGTESSSGAAARGQTAALAKHSNYKMFMGDFNNRYDQAYRLWARENGGSIVGDYMNGDHYRRFNRMVAERVEDINRSQGPLRQAHPTVEAAASLQFRGMDYMRKAMQKVGTIGSARLGDSSWGYMSRVVSAEKVRSLTAAQRKAVVGIYRDQFMELSGWDRAFAEEHARRILEIHDRRALGAVDMPLSIHDERMAGIVQDSLQAMNLPPERINELMGRFSRGGANFTKGRAELSLNTPYDIDGESFRLMDLVDTDVPKLYRQYAQRAAGEVALTQHGIQGRAGLETLRNALEKGPDGHKVTELEMRAYDQFAAEMLGVPFGTRNRAVDGLSTVTSILRLGGMGITQMGETFNGIHAVGLARTLATIPAIPRLIREASQQAKGGVPKNKILASVELLGGELGMDHYRAPIPYAQTDVIAKQAGLETYSKTERALRMGQNVQAKLSFHQTIMTAQTRGFAEQIVGKAMRFIREGGEDLALRDMGLTEAVVNGLKTDLPNIAQFSKTGELIALDLTKATDLTAAKEFVQSVNRGAAQIIQHTFVGETGKWAHDSFLKMLGQFRTFGLISVEKQWNRQQGVHGAAKAMGYILGAMSLAIPIQAARVFAASTGMSRSEADAYREKQLSPFALIKATMNYTSALGLTNDLADALSIPLGMEPSDARGMSGDIGRIVPAAGVANDVLKLGKAVSSWSPLSHRDAAKPYDALKNVTPFGRLPYLIPLMNAIGAD